MKKTNLLKLAFTMVAMFMYLGMMAQTYPATILTDYVQATETSYQTTGLGLTLYVAPDPVYSPSYDEATNTGMNGASEWQWVYGADFGTGTLLKAWTTGENYVVLAAGDLPAAGSTRLFWAAERFAATCADATGKSHLVTVIAEPTGLMEADNTSTNWTEVTAGTEYYRCGDGYVDDLNLTFTETGVPGTYDYYAYNITVTATGYDADGNVVVGPTDVTATYGTPISAAATDATFVDGPTTTVTIPATMDFVQLAAVDVQTKYEFTLASVASRISTVSHQRAGVANAFYADTDVVTYWLNLPPVTGPIYHIPNNVGL